jgi:peptidoglycan/LPS O-acetylase OafA/YrhL
VVVGPAFLPNRSTETAEHMRYPRLDVLRAIAIFAVFWHHVVYHVLLERGLSGAVVQGIWSLPSKPGEVRDWTSYFISQYGGWGVALFFVISGFCIHLSFLKWQSAPSGGFWRPYFIRRFLRIYPPYLFAMGLACVPLLLAKSGPDSTQLWTHVFMIHNLSAETLFGINPSFWSLAVEWQLYLVYPAFLFFCRRWGIGKFLLLVLLCDVLFRALGPASGEVRGLLLGQLPFAYWFTWGCGALCAERAWAGRPVILGWGTATVILLLAAAAAKVCQPLAWLSSPLLASGLALWCDGYGRCSAPLSRAEQIVLPLGIVSYSFYLVHQPLIVQLGARIEPRLFPGNPWLMAGVGGVLIFAVIFILSALMFRLVEKPSIAMGRSFSASS